MRKDNFILSINNDSFWGFPLDKTKIYPYSSLKSFCVELPLNSQNLAMCGDTVKQVEDYSKDNDTFDIALHVGDEIKKPCYISYKFLDTGFLKKFLLIEADYEELRFYYPESKKNVLVFRRDFSE